MPVLLIPVWAWLNAVVLIAAGAFVWGKLSSETTHKREGAHIAGAQSTSGDRARS
ncbi:MAG: hypothetical protein K2Y29_04920 [Beijerinckiaceae bacterium]|nr:hypothetical protein [Beijerinckiaceae bacterium]